MNPKAWVVPRYPPFFPVTDVMEWGKSLHKEIDDGITGKFAMTPADAGILAQAVVNASHGSYLEIGSLFGGSAILAALTKRKYGMAGRVFCIDDGEMTGRSYIEDNANLFDVVLGIHRGKSHPFPCEGQKFQIILIDAGHDYGWCIADWNNAKRHAEKYVIFHDYDPKHEGVVKAAQEAMQEWRAVYVAEHTAVLERP